jgi:hypothetical protein
MGLERGRLESMQPVMRALQTIAAIESETREAHGEAASTCPTETILSQDLSESSLVARFNQFEST